MHNQNGNLSGFADRGGGGIGGTGGGGIGDPVFLGGGGGGPLFLLGGIGGGRGICVSWVTSRFVMNENSDSIWIFGMSSIQSNLTVESAEKS